MSQAVPASVSTADQEPDPGALHTAHARTTFVAGRLMLAANTTLQSSFLFAYLYLRANNFGGMWRPAGVNPPATSINTLALMIPVLGVVALALAVRAAATGERRPVTRALGIALVVALATIAMRIYQLYQSGWNLTCPTTVCMTPPPTGAYVDVSILWFVVLLAEFVVGALWMLSLYMGHVRRTVAATKAQVQSLYEYWAFVTGVALFVYILVQFVN